jgi:hypothetical protein
MANAAQIKRADIVNHSFSGIFPRFANALLMVPLKEAVNAIPTIFAAETIEYYENGGFWQLSKVNG